MSKYLDKPNAVPAQGMTPNEASNTGKAVGQSKFHHFKNNITSIFMLALSTAGIVCWRAQWEKAYGMSLAKVVWRYSYHLP